MQSLYCTNKKECNFNLLVFKLLLKIRLKDGEYTKSNEYKKMLSNGQRRLLLYAEMIPEAERKPDNKR